MTKKPANALRVWFRLTWLGFVGALLAAVAFAISVRVVVKPVLDELGRAGINNPEILSEATQLVLIGGAPWVTGILTAIFLVMFVFSGLIFLVKAIRLMGTNPASEE